MNALPHITLIGVVLGTGSSLALTPPPPPCAYSGDTAEGREVISSGNWPNGFVTYSNYDNAERQYFYLEHCPSGKILRTRSEPETINSRGPRSASEIAGTIYDALASDKAYSIGDIQALLRDQGVANRRFTSRSESCACQTYYPDAVGSKTPYKKDAK